jgi:hypothetical protein
MFFVYLSVVFADPCGYAYLRLKTTGVRCNYMQVAGSRLYVIVICLYWDISVSIFYLEMCTL